MDQHNENHTGIKGRHAGITLELQAKRPKADNFKLNIYVAIKLNFYMLAAICNDDERLLLEDTYSMEKQEPYY